jgi:hypothetical protein
MRQLYVTTLAHTSGDISFRLEEAERAVEGYLTSEWLFPTERHIQLVLRWRAVATLLRELPWDIGHKVYRGFVLL